MLCYENSVNIIFCSPKTLRNPPEIHQKMIGNPSISLGNTWTSCYFVWKYMQNQRKSVQYARNPTKTAPVGLQSSKSIEILKKWSWSPPDPKIHGIRILVRDLCNKYEKMSATEGNQHMLAVQKIGKNSMDMRRVRFLKHPSSESAFLQQAL